MHLNASDPLSVGSCLAGLPTAAQVAVDPLHMLLDGSRAPPTCWPFTYAVAVVAPVARNSTQHGCTESNQTLVTMRTLIGPTYVFGTSRLLPALSVQGVPVPDEFLAVMQRSAGKITCDGAQVQPEVGVSGSWLRGLVLPAPGQAFSAVCLGPKHGSRRRMGL